MSKNVELTKEFGKDSYGIKGLTLEELRALHEAVKSANLPAARNLQDVRELLNETFNNK